MCPCNLVKRKPRIVHNEAKTSIYNRSWLRKIFKSPSPLLKKLENISAKKMFNISMPNICFQGLSLIEK